MADERLADILWPDADGDMAHHAFETTLMRLRKLLGYAEALKLSEGKLSLDHRFCWVDCWAFERLLGQRETEMRRQHADRAITLATKALSLYRGDFLSREEVEPWSISCAERLQRKFLQTASSLGRQLETACRWEESAALYHRCLDLDANSLEWHRRIAICQKHLGSAR